MSAPPARRWPDAVARRLQATVIDADDHLDAMWRRIDARLGRGKPRHLAAYRGYADARGVELVGRVLAEAPQGGPQEDAGWWDNLLDTYRRFESDEVPDVPLRLRYRGGGVDLRSDHEGYWHATFDAPGPMSDLLWDNAMASLADGSLLTAQPVLQVGARARFGVISDIDDTILQSSITDWKTAAQLTFLHNARTRKPLAGVAALYRALQGSHNPIFYVSSSPWNLYDLLEDFMELNGIPPGPIHLRDLGTDAGKFIKSPGHGHKLERAIHLIERFPTLRWVLLGDSGQADAELYAEAARTHPERIAAIYIRDVDPDADSPRDLGVDGHIHRVAGTGVPMLRVADSAAIARHAAELGLLDAAAIGAVDAEVGRDRQRPGLGEAALAEAATPPEPSAPRA
jgi:phosphatidate phosphatase APP1